MLFLSAYCCLLNALKLMPKVFPFFFSSKFSNRYMLNDIVIFILYCTLMDAFLGNAKVYNTVGLESELSGTRISAIDTTSIEIFNEVSCLQP